MISYLTVIPFLRDRVVLARVAGGRLKLAGVRLAPGEQWVHAALRELRKDIGASAQSLHPIRADRPDHRLVAWADVIIDGSPTSAGKGEVVEGIVSLEVAEAARLLASRGSGESAELVQLASAERSALTDDDWFRDTRVLLENAYLAQTDVYAQSGKSGGAASWELGRRFTAGAIHRDGTFLDLGCANGLLMESMVGWALADRAFRLEPFGLDISEALIELARRRLPLWADRMWVGNAWDWKPPRRFDFVHALPELVPDRLRARWLRRLLAEFLAPAGRLILRYGDPYPANPDRRTLPDLLEAAGLRADGELVQERTGAPPVRAAWFELA